MGNMNFCQYNNQYRRQLPKIYERFPMKDLTKNEFD